MLVERGKRLRLQGDWVEARACLQDAIQHYPEEAELHFNLGMLYYAQGEFADAASCFQRTVECDPTHAAAQANLGQAFRVQGNTAAAVANLQRAARLRPDSPQVHFNLGEAYYAHGDLPSAMGSFKQAIQLRPDYADAYYNLGLVSQQQGHYSTAQAAYEVARSLHADDADIHNNLGTVLQAQGDLEAAVVAYQEALRLRPGFPQAYSNLGTCLQQLGDFPAAQTSYEAGLRLEPDNAAMHNNLGTVFQAQGQFDDALQAYHTALETQPEYTEALWNRSLAWLAAGHLTQGWQAYEWRLQTPSWKPRHVAQRRWDGSSLYGKTILVSAEQGIGDELLFASCLPELSARAAHVVIECDARLVALLRRSFPRATVLGRADSAELPWPTEVPTADVHVPMASLPGHLRPTLGHFPAQPGYLVADPVRVAHWQSRLAALGPGLKAGLAWRSLRSRVVTPYYTWIEQWEPLLRLPGVQWINLQYDDYDSELADVVQQWDVHIHHWPDLDTWHDLDGVAALTVAVDLVLAPDITVAQLGAGLGAPVWRLTAYAENEMGLGTGISPWSPTLRTYRQPQPGDWAQVFARVATDLHQLIRQ
jgi:tetratricopeptide (TPR) repeat protein